MSWWKAKKKRRLEAEFRKKTIRLHEGCLFLHGELEVDVQVCKKYILFSSIFSVLYLTSLLQSVQVFFNPLLDDPKSILDYSFSS